MNQVPVGQSTSSCPDYSGRAYCLWHKYAQATQVQLCALYVRRGGGVGRGDTEQFCRSLPVSGRSDELWLRAVPAKPRLVIYLPC